MLTPFIRSGYPTVLIPIGDGNVKHFPLHRLVAETFLPNPLNLPQVNHKDQNKLNPRVDNLECVHVSIILITVTQFIDAS